MLDRHRPVSGVALLATILFVSACGSGAGVTAAPPGATAAPSPTTAPAPTAAPTPPASAPSDGSTPVHLVKNCSTYTAEIPTFCTISASNLTAVPVGAKVEYLGPLLDDPNFLSSNVLIDDAHGNTATGYCIFDARPTEERGFCAFSSGTGGLAGFKAILKVTIDANGEWHLDGDSYGNRPSPRPS